MQRGFLLACEVQFLLLKRLRQRAETDPAESRSRPTPPLAVPKALGGKRPLAEVLEEERKGHIAPDFDSSADMWCPAFEWTKCSIMSTQCICMQLLPDVILPLPSSE